MKDVERVALRICGANSAMEAPCQKPCTICTAQAAAAMRETRLIDAEALRATALGRGIPDNPEQIINDLADWLKGRANAE